MSNLMSPMGLCRFPCGEGYRRWIVADAGLHRLAVIGEDGSMLRALGAGVPGFRDGALEEARFRAPQGVACSCAAIYVADTGNHALRKIDLMTNRVSTLAGTGSPGRRLNGEAPARELGLAGVTTVALMGDRLLFVNADTHQWGALDLSRGVIAPLAGTGEAGSDDGMALESRLDHPVGLTFSPLTGILYGLDQGGNVVRVLSRAGELETLGEVQGNTRGGSRGRGVALAGSRLWIMGDDPHPLSWWDLATGGWGRVGDWMGLDPPLTGPTGLAPDGPGRILVTEASRQRLLWVDVEDHRVLRLA